MQEIWKDVPGYEGIYHISNLGNMRKAPSELKKTIQNGYEFVNLTKNKQAKKIPIHRLVALAFIPNPSDKETVNHIDGNKQNNSTTNLEWCAPEDNVRHAWKTGLCKGGNRISAKVTEQVKEFLDKGATHSDIKYMLGISSDSIRKIKKSRDV